MKEFPVVCIAMSLLLVALMMSSVQNVKMVSSDEISERCVALTFDDGPKAGKTDALLDMLEQKGVKATFFLIGAQVEEGAELVKRMDADGHQIGIHTFKHVDLSCLNEADQREEIEKSKEAIEKVLKRSEKFVVRPPFGQMNSALEQWINAPIILWDVDTEDWTGKAAQDIIMETVETVRDGDIILMHDISEHGLEGASGIIDELQQMGYTFLTIDELFLSKGITLENGGIYRYAR